MDVGERNVKGEALQHTVADLVPATDYVFRISATAKCGKGDLSNAASAHTQMDGKNLDHVYTCSTNFFRVVS